MKRAPWNGGHLRAHSSEAIEEEISKLRSMADGRRPVFFGIGSMFASQGLSLAEVEGALRAVAGRDGRLLEKIPGVVDSLMRYGRLK
jgi:hypothetical protein